MVIAELVVRGVERTELDDARLIALLPALGLDDLEAMPLGGRATSTALLRAESAAARFTTVVVFPTPPF